MMMNVDIVVNTIVAINASKTKTIVGGGHSKYHHDHNNVCVWQLFYGLDIWILIEPCTINLILVHIPHHT